MDMDFLPLLPELYVSDFEKSLRFYVECLGFKLEYQREKPKFGFLSYQGSQLMIQELEPGEKEEEKLEYPFGRGINFQIETESIREVTEALEEKEYQLERGVKDSWYRVEDTLVGCREILVRDPDGYLLRFSEDLGTKDAG
jgi:lactoylglutathione lyase